MHLAKAERIKVLEVALNNESREKDFHRNHAVTTTIPLGRLMFKSLANDESEFLSGMVETLAFRRSKFFIVALRLIIQLISINQFSNPSSSRRG